MTRYHRITLPRAAPGARRHALHEGACMLQKLLVSVTDATADVGEDTDESYVLTLPSPASVFHAAALRCEGPGLVGKLRAKTAVGAYRGLETFSQLVSFDYDSKSYVIVGVPWEIADAPRFKHRELLIDSARHFLPVATVKAVIAALPFVKINVLHWHILDSQSFPLETPSAPLLSERGAYSKQERYTTEDIGELVRFARLHGVRLVPEVDTPAHAASWCEGHPDICPSAACPEPLSPVMPTVLTPHASDATFDVVESVVKDVSGMFPDALLHLGGDEVNTHCWQESESIRAWLLANGNMSSEQAVREFTQRAHKVARAQGKTVVVWDEVFDLFAGKIAGWGDDVGLDASTIIQQWRWSWDHVDKTKAITDAGFRLLWMVDTTWYLDQLHETWETMGSVDVCEGLDSRQCALVLGGGAAMWGEKIDASNVLQTIFPRLAAVAEALWSPLPSASPPSALSSHSSSADTKARFANFRCLLNRRGVPAAPLSNVLAGTAPPEPGACMAQ